MPSQTQTRESDDEGEDFESEPSEMHVRRTRRRVSSASGGAVNLGNVGHVSLRRGRTDSMSTDLKACIVCQGEKKIDKYTVEPLTQCLTYQASHTFLEPARMHRHTKKGRRFLMAIENEDLVAIEVRYHRFCYSSFTHKRNLERVASSAPCSSLVEDEESSDETLPFATVFAEVEDQLFQKKNVLQLSSIRERYEELVDKSNLSGNQAQPAPAPGHRVIRNNKLKTCLISIAPIWLRMRELKNGGRQEDAPLIWEGMKKCHRY